MILGIPKKALIIGAVLVGVFLIYLLGANKPPSEAEGGTPQSACRTTVSATVLNIRAEPNPTAPIVGKLQQNAQVEALAETQNGFRKLAENKWAATQYLTPCA